MRLRKPTAVDPERDFEGEHPLRTQLRRQEVGPVPRLGRDIWADVTARAAATQSEICSGNCGVLKLRSYISGEESVCVTDTTGH